MRMEGKRKVGGGVDGEMRRGTAREREMEAEGGGAMLQCSGRFPRAVLLLVNKQNTGLS